VGARKDKIIIHPMAATVAIVWFLLVFNRVCDAVDFDIGMKE
jgi:uncharacterized integral membrane protein